MDGGVSGAPKLVAVIMGSQSDWAVMRRAVETLDALGVGCDARIVSAHRTPDRLVAFAKGARAEGFKVIIAGAGGAAHLPGMTAAFTTLPVFGVPVPTRTLGGEDSLAVSRALVEEEARGRGEGRRVRRVSVHQALNVREDLPEIAPQDEELAVARFDAPERTRVRRELGGIERVDVGRERRE